MAFEQHDEHQRLTPEALLINLMQIGRRGISQAHHGANMPWQGRPYHNQALDPCFPNAKKNRTGFLLPIRVSGAFATFTS